MRTDQQVGATAAVCLRRRVLLRRFAGSAVLLGVLSTLSSIASACGGQPSPRSDGPHDPGSAATEAPSTAAEAESAPPVALASAAPVPATPTANPVQLGPGASLGGRRLFPDDNPWNADISQAPLDPASDALIASLGPDTELHPDFGTVYHGAPNGIPYVVVPGTQPLVPVSFRTADESDPGPYPIPPDAPIEGGPSSTGDRHVLVLDRDHWKLFELFAARPEDAGARWTAGSGAVFDLASNTLRPARWTSADAAGLPILPGLVRYDEAVEQGAIRHALRFTAPHTRRAYVPPARHFASDRQDSNLPPMGMRVRLKASYNIGPFPAPVQAILRALKLYGMFVADNGPSWFISGVPDRRWSDDDLATIRRVKGREFEVVRMDGLAAG